ncbi:MAG: bifunctional DNA-formamidopyrimidine glycosylase/DNA-(apurinic or apyrimidinic site) lyase [Verrucomicrobia subdivision 3 bacterium]|nr:bifunctional DNA-formamidopyrimidine glycosylase/DNA-(apurinic or apyrimidinic site) lyase [Limisphaerales bacterium]
MPELPEVEVLTRHLGPALRGKTVSEVRVHRTKSTRPTSARALRAKLVGAKFISVTRRAKYLLFKLNQPLHEPFILLGHLGMTGRIFVQPTAAPLPKHAAVTLGLGRHICVFEDTRYFGRLTLDLSPLESLGPEPLGDAFDGAILHTALRRSAQAIKPKLLDQKTLAGVGNIYASESLWRAGISPRKAARRLTRAQCVALAASIREVLTEAIVCGSTVPLDFAGAEKRNHLFYYGSLAGPQGFEERLRVYNRADEPCDRCATSIRQITQAARSTYYCPQCQGG